MTDRQFIYLSKKVFLLTLGSGAYKIQLAGHFVSQFLAFTNRIGDQQKHTIVSNRQDTSKLSYSCKIINVVF